MSDLTELFDKIGSLPEVEEPEEALPAALNAIAEAIKALKGVSATPEQVAALSVKLDQVLARCDALEKCVKEIEMPEVPEAQETDLKPIERAIALLSSVVSKLSDKVDAIVASNKALKAETAGAARIAQALIDSRNMPFELAINRDAADLARTVTVKPT